MNITEKINAVAFKYVKTVKENPRTLILGISNYYKLQEELGQENVRSYKTMGIEIDVTNPERLEVKR